MLQPLHVLPIPVLQMEPPPPPSPLVREKKNLKTKSIPKSFSMVEGFDRRFQCSKCGKSYTTKSCLQRHQRYECPLRPKARPSFSCSMCGYATNRRDNLKAHERLHQSRYK